MEQRAKKHKGKNHMTIKELGRHVQQLAKNCMKHIKRVVVIRRSS